MARYSVLSEGRQIFAARYRKVLPSEAQWAREIERGLVEARRAVGGVGG